MTPKSRLFWSLLTLVLVADRLTKIAAVAALTLHVPHRVVGDVVRLTLSYNVGAAFGMSLGAFSRIGFSVVALAVLTVLGVMYRRTGAGDRLRAAALGLVVGGALGNLTDRLLSGRGVVDFVDIGIGAVRYWTFNVADAGISTGVVLLGLSMIREDKASGKS